MYIVAQALKNTKISGDLPKDRTALRDALPSVQSTPPPFKFRQANDRAGKPAGYDADQAPIVSVTKDGKYVIE